MSAIMSKSAMLRQYELEHELENAVRRLGLCVTRPWSTTEPRVWLRAVGPSARTGRWIVWPDFSADQQEVDTPTAALFLLLLGLPEVAVTCPDCLARGAGGKLARWEWCHRLALGWYHPAYRDDLDRARRSPAGPSSIPARYEPAVEHRCAIVVSLMAQGWTVGWTAKRTSGFDIVASRPCPTCTVDGEPTGKVKREPARLLLDAMPTEGTPPSRLDVQTRDVEPPPGVTLGPGQRWVQDVHTRAQGLDFPIELASPGDPVARESLSVLADELQASGNPRGEWLSLWLRGAVETDAGHTMPIDTALPAIAAELRGLQ